MVLDVPECAGPSTAMLDLVVAQMGALAEATTAEAPLPEVPPVATDLHVA
jgi:hypothetical protein